MDIQKASACLLHTAHKTTLSLENGALAHSPAPIDPVYFMPLTQDLGLLAPGSNLAALFHNEPAPSNWSLLKEDVFASVHLIRYVSNEKGRLAFVHISRRAFISARFADARDINSRIIGLMPEAREWEQFEPEYQDLPYNLDTFRLEMAALLERTQDCASLIEKCAHNSRAAIELALQRYPLNSLPSYYESGKILNLAPEVFRQFPEDGFLKAICKNEEKSEDSSRIKISPAADSFLEPYAGTTKTQLPGGYFNEAWRKSLRPQRGCCIVTCAKDEGPYLLEWIAYYRCIGLKDIFIYTNDNKDGSDALLEALARAGFINLIKSEDIVLSAQHRGNQHALLVNRDILAFEWALFIDVDEFLWLNPALFSNIDEFIAFHDENRSDAILINMTSFSMNGNLYYSDEILSERSPCIDPSIGGYVKTLLKPLKIRSHNVHAPSRSLLPPPPPNIAAPVE